VPLLDMRRFSVLLAGASWMEEYGDPDRPEDWAFLEALSPYHNLRPDAGYPPVLFMTTTRDDRVHPAHARKMMAKMAAMGCDARYFENLEGGHGAGADNRQTAHFRALTYAFLARTLSAG
jgi:prolyl oligopeptidase